MENLTTTKHLAGIIPIAHHESFFDMPWHDCLMPIGKDYLAIEKAVFDCAMAGCDTIWIVGHMNMQPLIRKRIGEMVFDPLKIYSGKELNFKRHDAESKRVEIQIYYVPIHPKDRDRRDSLGYSILYGADTAFKTCLNISKWATPNMFFCSFPYGIVSEQTMYEVRKLANKTTSMMVVHEGKTIKDGLMLPFTFSGKDYIRCRNHLNDYASTVWENAENKNAELPTMHFSLKDVFNALDTSSSNLVQCDWFYEIDTWEKYRKFLVSEESNKIKMRDDLRSPEKRTVLNFDKEVVKND